MNIQGQFKNEEVDTDTGEGGGNEIPPVDKAR